MNKCQFKKYLEEANAYLCVLNKKFTIKKEGKKAESFLKKFKKVF